MYGHGTGCVGANGCGQQGYPEGVRITNLLQSNSDWSTFIAIDGETYIGGGVKIDTNGSLPKSSMGGEKFRDIIIEQPNAGGIIVDPRHASQFQPVLLDNVTLQDNFMAYQGCVLGYTDPATAGRGGAIVFAMNATNTTCMTNAYMNGTLEVNGVDYAMGTFSLPTYLGLGFTLNDGVTTETELRGEGAGFGPSIIPYATQNVTTDPSAWTCNNGCSVVTGEQAPDGSATAGEIIAGSNAASWVNVGSMSTATAAGDWVISGAWCMGGVGNTNGCRSAYGFEAMAVVSGGTDVFDYVGPSAPSSQF